MTLANLFRLENYCMLRVTFLVPTIKRAPIFLSSAKESSEPFHLFFDLLWQAKFLVRQKTTRIRITNKNARDHGQKRPAPHQQKVENQKN